MQAIAPVTADQLRQAYQEPRYKFEIYHGAGWKDLSNWAGENYVQDVSIGIAGARVNPEPVAGTWQATLMDEDGMFHPDHPTSLLTDWLKAGVRVMISIGGEYGGVDYYWRRIVGRMEEPRFSVDNSKIYLRGFDYAQQLTDAKLKPPDNYWGAIETISTVASENAYGAEIYAEADAMEIGGGEANNVANWTAAGGGGVSISSVADAGGGSTWVGEIILGATPENDRMLNDNIGSVTAGKQYRVTFKYKVQIGEMTADVNIYASGAGGELMGGTTCPHSATYVSRTFFFTASKTDTIRMTLENFEGGFELESWRIDEISVKEVTGIQNTRYDMPEACTGIHQVVLDDKLVPYGKKDEGWRYDETVKKLFWDGDKQVETGTDNLLVSYYTNQDLDNVIADLLYFAGLYGSRAEALAGMLYTPSGITIDRVWFKEGTLVQKAVGMVCERINYRFYFNHNGSPVFEPAPTAKGVGFEDFDLSQCHISTVQDSQNREEIRNYITIEGEKRDQIEEKESAIPSSWKGVDSELGSIGIYGEHTKSINNHLFQDQDSVDDYATIYLLAFKDPKWYVAFTTRINPTPLEIGDTVRWQERLSAPARQDNYYGAFLYGERLYGDNGIVIIKRGLIRDIRLTNSNVAYTLEKVE